MEKWEVQTLRDAQEFISERTKEGVECLCCEQHVQSYHFSMHKGMIFALSLIELATKTNSCDKQKWVHVERYLTEKKSNLNGYHPKLEHWGLLERHPDLRGYWRVTKKGRKFLAGLISLPKVAILYNGECLGLTGEKNFVSSILEGFKYSSMISQLATSSDVSVIFNRWKKEGVEDEPKN